MKEIERFEKWVKDGQWPKETLQFHLSMYVQTFPGRVLKLIHDLFREFRKDDYQGESYETESKRSSYGFGDPSRITAEAEGQVARDSERDQPSLE
jgi:hypothetical protein